MNNPKFFGCLSLLTLAACKTTTPHEVKDNSPKKYEYQNWIIENTVDESEVPACDSGCAEVNVMIELPKHPDDNNIGHTAIAIDNKFYDFGPANIPNGPHLSSKSGNCEAKYSCPGAPWWGNKYNDFSVTDKETNKLMTYPVFRHAKKHSDITYANVKEKLGLLAGSTPTIRVPVCVTKTSASRIVGWWEQFYQNVPLYQIPGAHCTSTVYRSIMYGDLEGETEIHTKRPQDVSSWFSGGTMSPHNFSRLILSSPEKVFAKRMLCGKQTHKFVAVWMNRKDSFLE